MTKIDFLRRLYLIESDIDSVTLVYDDRSGYCFYEWSTDQTLKMWNFFLSENPTWKQTRQLVSDIKAFGRVTQSLKAPFTRPKALMYC